MALAEELTKWSGVYEDLAQKRARRPYIGELAELSRDFERARAEEQQARAGMAGLQLEFEPQRQQQLTEQGRLVNLINQMKLKQIQQEMASPQGPSFQTKLGQMLGEQQAIEEFFGPESPQAAMYRQSLQQQLAEKEPAYVTEFGKILGEQERIAQQFGPESPQAQQYQQFLESKLPGAVGAPVLTPFEGPSGVPMEIVSTGQKDKIFRKDPITNDYYQPVTEKRFTDNLEKIEVIKSVNKDLENLKDIAPIFQSGWKGNWRDAQVLVSEITGKQFSGTDAKAAGNAILASIKDKIMKLEGFPSLLPAYADAEKIVKIGSGESVKAYQNRIDKLKNKFDEEQLNLNQENMYGAKITPGKRKEEKPKAAGNWAINPQTGRPVLR